MVTLMGSADVRGSARATELAKSITGVRSVRNEIKVSAVR
jgi:osmotically-inducible protein OsmY